MNKKLTIFAVMALVAAFMARGGGVAQATHLSCGDTLTASVSLDADLGPCASKGFDIGANGVTVDLNGFTLTGTGTTAEVDVGVNIDGFERVTVKNGTIVGFASAIRAVDAKDIKLDHLVISGDRSYHAVDIVDSKKLKIEHSSITVTPIGLVWAKEAIRLESVDDVKIKNVDVDGGNIGVNFACGDCDGTEAPTNGKIEHSTFTGQIIGILIANSTKAELKENHISGGLDCPGTIGSPACHPFGPFTIGNKGISVDSDFGAGGVVTGTKVKNNHVHDNEGIGIRVLAVATTTTSGIEVKGNLVRDNDSDGILLVDADASKIKDNLVNHNGGDGISLTVGSTGNEIKNNGATGNAGTDMVHDGTSTGNTWTGNTCGTSAPALGEVDCP